MSPTPHEPAATLDDLRRFDGRAELIAGRIVPLSPAGHRPSRIAGEVFLRLWDYARTTHRASAHTGGIAFTVPRLRSGRQSFSPDASYYAGPPPADDMDFISGPPTLAVEVRSKGDYGAAAEAAMAAKRSDYFESGTLVVWDVDPISGLIHSHRSTASDLPSSFSPGQAADAEPALPGWRAAVDELFA